MLTIEKRKAYGANVDKGLGRCMNNETFYPRVINMAADDAGFERLRSAMGKNDRKECFEAVHALKGILGNLALTHGCQTGVRTDRDAADRDGNRLPCASGRNSGPESETAAAER